MPKMMNFGKSRARMMLPDDKKVTFQNVAGLQEEKRRSGRGCRFFKSSSEIYECRSKDPKRCSSCRTSGNR